MDSYNSFRIQPLSVAPSTSRQTPNNDFGAVMARTTVEVLRSGAGFLSPSASGTPVLTAALTGLNQVAASTLAAPAAVLPGVSTVPAGKSEPWDLMEAQRLLQQDGASLNAQYLGLQNEMQRESREFNTLTNILKVRHDSAKAAINNIR